MADLIDYTNAVKAGLDGKAPVGHTHTAAAVTDLTETVQDIVGALLVAGVNTTITYNDTAGTVTIDSAGGGGGGTDPEIVRDVIGGTLVAGSGIQITVNDAADTITVASTATVNSTDAALRDRSTHTGTQAASTISDSTALGRSVLTATDAMAARAAIGAGTSSLTLGTSADTAKAGDYAPPAATDTLSGLVELATAAEGNTGTDSTRATTPAAARAAAMGSIFTYARALYLRNEGVVADGATQEASTIQTAITKAGTGGTVVFDGVSVINQTLLPRPDQTWRFLPGAQLKAAAGPAFNMVQVGLAAGAYTFDGMVLDGNKANVTGATDTVGVPLYITAARPDRTTLFRNVTVINSPSHGIRGQASSAAAGYPIKLDGVTVIDAARAGVFLRYLKATLKGGTVTGAGAEGIIINQCDDSRVIGAIANNNGKHGLVFVYCADWKAIGNTCNGNGTALGEGAAGIAAGGGEVGLPVNVRYSLVGNTCNDNRTHGITVDPTVVGAPSAKQEQHASLVGNVCNNNRENHGIYIHNASYMSLVGNECFNNAMDGIAVNGAHITVGDNNLSGNQRYGLNIQDVAGAGQIRIGINNLAGNGFSQMYVGPTVPDVQLATSITAPTGQTVSVGDNAGTVITVRKETATVRNNTIAPTADPGLTTSLGVGTYLVEAMLFYDSTATADFRAGWNLPVGASIQWTPEGLASGTTSPTNALNRTALTVAAAQIVGAAGIGTRLVSMPRGVLTITAAGTFAVIWAQGVAEASNTTLFEGSTLTLTKIA